MSTLERRVSMLISRGTRLREGNVQWNSLWQDVAKLFDPNRAEFLTDSLDGDERDEDLFIATPQLAKRNLATAISTMLRPPGRTWFKARAKSESLNRNPDVRAWLDRATAITYDQMYDARARFEEHASEVDSDLVTFGTGILFIGVDRGQGHLIFRTHGLRDVVLIENAQALIDGIYMWRKLTASKIEQMFGAENLSRRVAEALRAQNPKPDQMFEILHVVLPNEEFARSGFQLGRLPYTSMWIDPKEKHIFSESGFWEFPFAVPRWDTSTNETYGRSPAMTALPDARVANAIARTLLRAGEKAVDPPLTAPADMLRGDIELFAGGLTLYDGQGFQFQGPPVRPIELGKNMPLGLEILQQYEQRIFAIFFRDILELPNRPDLTAEEVRARTDEFLREAAPVFARIEADYNARVVERCFAILARLGAFGEAPEALQGREIEFEYESPIKFARDRERATRVLEGINNVSLMAQVNPEVLDNINWDNTTKLVMRDLGVPEEILANEQAIAQLRQARAEQQQMQQAALAAQTAGDAAGALAQGQQALDQANVDPDALDETLAAVGAS